MTANLNVKTKTKQTVRKDLFGNQRSNNENEASQQHCSSPLKSIWGEGNSNSEASSNSVLLSPALKRSPNRFSTSPKIQKNSSTSKSKSTTPRKLSKYSPFRKSKVYNSAPNNSIKKFFPVKEQNLREKDDLSTESDSFGIQPLNYCTTVLTENTVCANQCSQIGLESDIQSQGVIDSFVAKPSPSYDVLSPNKDISSSRMHIQSTPVKKGNRSSPQSATKLSPSPKKRDIYASFLLRIALEVMLIELDENVASVLSEEESEYINLFNKFDQPSQRLYGRLLNRKIDWIKTSTMKYGDIQLQLMQLNQQHFITTDCDGESSETLLNLLNLPELKKLCKTFKIPERGVKSEIIAKLISRGKQPSIKSFFSQPRSNSSNDVNLRNKIYELLGCVVKVTKGPLQAFSRCLLYFSYPHFRGLERDRFSDQLALHGELQNLKFPQYEKCRSNVFQSRDHFLMYESALLESSVLLEARENKDWETSVQQLRYIANKLEQFLSNEKRRCDAEALPDFLRRFTAGGCYVRAISSTVDVLRSKDTELVEHCLELLLRQRLFCCHRRGLWYEQLACLYQNNCRDNVKASHTILRGLKDQYIDQVSKHALCARAAMLEGRKKDGLKDYLKDALATQRGRVSPLTEPDTITITEQVLESNVPGYKRVYVQDSEDGKMLSSVEEVVVQYYRQQGYIQGGHDEGGTIKSLVLSCYWDYIYGETMAEGHGLFQSEYQTVPLDWNCESFYERRREKLRSKLQDLAEGGIEAVTLAYQSCFLQHFGDESIINWKCLHNYDIGQSLLKSLGIDLFLNLSRLLLKHHREYKSGFPDLTLWNPEESKCIFVEVKSPNDQLSMRQRLWLHSLTKMGASAVVCHVNSVGCRGLKRKQRMETEVE